SYLQSCSSKFAHNAPGLKALLTFKLHDEDAAEGFFGDIVRVCGPQMVLKNVRDIHGLRSCNCSLTDESHMRAFPEVHDKTRATGTGPTVKTTSKITKSDGYGSKPESRAVSSEVSTKGSNLFFLYLESIIVQLQCVCQEFEATSKDPEGYSVDDLIKEFRSCLSAKTFDISLMGASSKSCEYVLDTLMQVFEDKWFAHAVKERTLDNLITEILIWLLDERVPRMHDGSQLLKVLNVLMLKILDNAKRTSSFVVLISLLIPLHPSRWPSPPSNESFATRNMKFSNLVVKCLIKLTKDLQSYHSEVDLDHILQSSCILQRTGIDEKKIRRSENWLQSTTTTTIPNSAGARLTYLSLLQNDIEQLYLRFDAVLQLNISEDRDSGAKQTFEMIDADTVQLVCYCIIVPVFCGIN
ncbi:hypothetical protein Tco_1089001, partial [Tanacetum coccineum]